MEVYINDILVKSIQEEDHIIDLGEALKMLHKYQMKLNLKKLTFGVITGNFLGYIISQR